MRWVTEYFECSCSGLTEGDELLTTPSQRLYPVSYTHLTLPTTPYV